MDPLSCFQALKNSNVLVSVLNLNSSDKIITIKENGLADANFVLTHIMKQIFLHEHNKLCLVILHNTIGHYHNVGKRLGYDLLKQIEKGAAKIIEPLKIIVGNIGDAKNPCTSPNFLHIDKETIAKELFLSIKKQLEELLVAENNGQFYLVIDDISHLLDLGLDAGLIVSLVNCCVNFDDRLVSVINCHVTSKYDGIFSNALSYISDLTIEVFPLKTGRSHSVTGIIKINRPDNENVSALNMYHYKAYDREVKVFAPGESLNYLYK